MSMRTYVYTGWGITDTYLKGVSVERQMAFIKKLLPEVQELMDQEEVTADNFEEWIADYESDDGLTFGFVAVFADAINQHEEGFDVVGICDDEGYAIVIYEDRHPWEMSDRVKNMTEDDMTDIFNKYLEMLGLAGEVEVGRRSAEIWG